VWGVGFRDPLAAHDLTDHAHLLLISGFGFRVSGFGFWVSGFEFRVLSFGFRVSSSGVRDSGLVESGTESPGTDIRSFPLEPRTEFHRISVLMAKIGPDGTFRFLRIAQCFEKLSIFWKIC